MKIECRETNRRYFILNPIIIVLGVVGFVILVGVGLWISTGVKDIVTP